MELNDKSLQMRLNAAETKIARISSDGINDALFAVRAKTPAYLRGAIDRPTPFTLSPSATVVSKADTSSLSGSLRVADLQARYLSKIENGETSNNILKPVMRSILNGYGNINSTMTMTRENLARIAGDTKNQKNGFFVGMPTGAKKGYSGIFQRRGRVRYVTVAIFVKQRTNERKLGLGEFWSNDLKTEASNAIDRRFGYSGNDL